METWNLYLLAGCIVTAIDLLLMREFHRKKLLDILKSTPEEIRSLVAIMGISIAVLLGVLIWPALVMREMFRKP